MSKKIVVTIAKNGTTTVSAQGYAGTACMKATAPFEELLDDNTKVDTKTPDYYKTENSIKEREAE
jgi:hypothetical protein